MRALATRSRSRPYLGAGDAFDRAIEGFADAYADQTERDYEALRTAVKNGRLAAETGV